MRILIIDPVGGISGDMLLGSLIHLGCPKEHLESVFRLLPVDGFSLKTSLRSVQGITALDLSFDCGHSHGHRTYASIRDTILSPLPDAVRDRAGRIFLALAEAEAEVHGVSVEEVHFHEVGALDSILDIVGIAAAIDYLSVRSVYCRRVPLGTGTTRSMHGTIPLPAPATVKLLEGMNVRFTDIEYELTTPTGAAAIAALADPGSPPPDLTIKSVGYGCGDREIPGWPNLCRCILCETKEQGYAPHMYLVEADVDDMSPEETETALARLFDAGALDAHLVPKIMKRGRPGFCFESVCPAERLEEVMACLLTHTTSIGARFHPIERRVLERTSYTISTRWGEVRVKESTLPDGSKRAKIEYRDLARISDREGLPVASVREEVLRLIREGSSGGSPNPGEMHREDTTGRKP
ncbi:MAG TPA: nickel pincer cofactor biosynthesis protein LarC [Deltaproteobacteria bacterium]|nr:nickel pincer cofactor biosynthesis protein LarC [Deltaproteobacteria bacterium]HRT46270.1 nickel pincer cofactor biosynthesis protein LarC [Desulfomonilia bacterium]